MTGTVLILGSTGRFGRNAAIAFRAAGWTVRGFDRFKDDLLTSARGVDVIVNGWNPPYPEWAQFVPDLHAQVISAARAAGATVILPGNVYVFAPDTPGPWTADTPHLAINPLGQIRVRMEEAYRSSGVRTIVLRAGDFIDTQASGNWFDQIMIKPLAKGRFVYPGNPDITHAWAYLPDLARAAVLLAEMRNDLPRFCDIPFAGYKLTGNQIAEALSKVTCGPVRLKQMHWWPINLARPFWKLAPHLIEMRYLWNTPHSLDGSLFENLVEGFKPTPLENALKTALPHAASGTGQKLTANSVHELS